VHRQVQERVRAAGLDRVVFGQRGVGIVQFGVVLGVFVDPVGGDRFEGVSGVCSRSLRRVSQKKRRTSWRDGSNIGSLCVRRLVGLAVEAPRWRG